MIRIQARKSQYHYSNMWFKYLHWKEKYVNKATYSAPFLLLVNSANTRKRLYPRPVFVHRTHCNRTAKESKKLSATAPLLITRIARRCSYATLSQERIMQPENTHFPISISIFGWISPDHLPNLRRLTAVKVSTP
jgi:hypothetical protein